MSFALSVVRIIAPRYLGSQPENGYTKMIQPLIQPCTNLDPTYLLW